jgi:hypothetical protein
LLLSAIGYGLSYLYRWETLWGAAIFAGIASATAVVLVLAVLLQLARTAVGATYRYTWSTFTAEEIIESLASAAASIDDADAAYKDSDKFPTAVWYQTRAARTLNHVASCIEQYLPGWMGLNDQPALRGAVLPQLLGVAAHVRKLAYQCLLPQPDTRDTVKLEIYGLLVSSACGHWGTWQSTTAPDSYEARVAEQVGVAQQSRLFSLRNLGGVLMKLIPLILVTAGLLLLYRSDPKSKLLDPNVVGPLTAAAFAYLTTMIVSGVNPRPDPARPSRPGLKERIGKRSA